MNKSTFLDEASAMDEWQRRQVAAAHEEWPRFWIGLILGFAITGTVIAVCTAVYFAVKY